MRHFLKKGMAALLSAVIAVTAVPQLAKEVHAAENQLPTKEQFATVEELKSFDTNDNDGKNPAKVYFGNNNQQWWIAGSQNADSMTMFAASPLATGQRFEPNESQNKTYSDGWACDYIGTGGSNPTDVYPNHYGASPLRTTLQGLETSYFTDAEQKLMKLTTIYTNDTKNSSVYSTTNKLYLAYGDCDDNQYITVGTNSLNTLNKGLRIDKPYWASATLWLRAPDLKEIKFVLAADPGYCVHNLYIENGYALVPAFELNLSSVIFASAAPAASEGNLTIADIDGDGAFTLRYDASKHQKNLGSALISFDKSKVTLTNVPNSTYLVVQNNVGAKAKQITSETEVSASDMGLDNFANCKVWLETTDTANRMTYATLAINEPLNIEGGTQGVDYTYENGVITFKKPGNYRVIGEGVPAERRIIVDNIENITITLKNVSLYTTGGNSSSPISPISIKNNSNVTLNLEGVNIITAVPEGKNFAWGAGIAVSYDSTLIIDGTGSLKSIGGAGGAGIGGETETGNCGTIIINNGTIYAKGGGGAAGIGLRTDGGKIKEITINGGNITACTNDSAPGIGKGIIENLRINGGVIEAIGHGYAGIQGTEQSNISINPLAAIIKSNNGISPASKDLNGSELTLFEYESNNENIFIDENEIKKFPNENKYYLYLTKQNHQVADGKYNSILKYDQNTGTFTQIGNTASSITVSLPGNVTEYNYEDQITLNVSVDLAEKRSFFERLFTNDNTVTAYVGDTAISSPVELDKNNQATLTIDTKNENVRKVLKPSDQAQAITVKYNGSKNLKNTEKDISITLHKKDTTISFKDTAFNLSRAYNGKAVTVDEANDIHKTENAPEVTLNWKTADGTALNTAPLKAGRYRLIVSIPADEYYNGSSVQHDFEISKAKLSVEVKVKDKQYDGFNTAEIETAALLGVADGDQIILINGTPTFASVEVGENIAIHFTEFTLKAEEDVLDNYTLIQPTGVTASITNTWVPKKDVEYTTSQPNGNGWVKEDFKIQAKEGYLLALGNKADGSRSTNWSKELAGSEEGKSSITFYVKNEQTGAISTQVTEQYQLDKTNPMVNGLVKDKVYCKEITFTVEETYPDVVKANEKELTPNENGVYTLTAGNHQITVRDQAGNETALAVTVNAEHTPNTDDGDCTTAITCAVCGTVVREAQEHSFTTYTSDSNAGCLTDGTKTAECDHEGCVQIKTVTEEGSALGHDWGEWETVISPDCENKGSARHICKRCSLTETKDLDANGHDWEEEFTVDQEATCTQDGSKSIHCKICAAVKDSTSIPATGHAYGEPQWNWGEDGKTAKATFICQNDSSHVETKSAEITSAVKEPATCTQEGITTYTATVTFEETVYTDTKEAADIEALGHDWEKEYTVDKEASCTEDGSKSIHCKNCDATKDSIVIPAKGGHIYGEPKWNWNEDGKTATVAFTCQNDSSHVETKSAEITSTVKEHATCTQEGITTYTATVTFEGTVYTDTKEVTDIPVLAHDWEADFTVDQEATCTEDGSKSIHCKNCDAIKDSMAIPAAGHKYIHGVCKVCGWKDPNYQDHEAGDGSVNSWSKGDEHGLLVQTPGEIGKVTDVILNGKTLAEGTDYVVNDGTVILKPNVLEELKEGNYTLTVYGEKGSMGTQIKIEKNITPAPQEPENSAKTEIEKTDQESGNPGTGDSVNLGLWLGLLLVSIGGISITCFYKKDKHH